MSKIFLSFDTVSVNSSLLKEELRMLGHEFLNNESFFNNDVLQNISRLSQSLISKCDVFICFLNIQSPTVYFELGVATALRKQILILGTDRTELPDELKSYRYVDIDSPNWILDVALQLRDIKPKIEEEEIIDVQTQSAQELINKLIDNKDLIDKLDVSKFELIIKSWFQEQGFNVMDVEGLHSIGCDYLVRDPRGNNLIVVEIKKKNINSQVSVMDIQKVLGAIHYNKADKGLVISSSGYTSSAKHFSNTCEPKIELLYLDDLKR